MFPLFMGTYNGLYAIGTIHAYINGMKTQTNKIGDKAMKANTAERIADIAGAIAVITIVLLVAFAWIFGIIFLMTN
jgi:hypothetical protein